MDIKKLVTVLSLFLMSAMMLSACGSKSDSKNADFEEKEVDFKKDVIDTKTKVVDGKEVKEYTMSDGSVVQVPADQDSLGGEDN